jgi:hypothetical protein
MFQQSIFVLSLAASALAQSSIFSDPKSTISFSQWTADPKDPKLGGYSFGVALPSNVTTDFIGQFVS